MSEQRLGERIEVARQEWGAGQLGIELAIWRDQATYTETKLDAMLGLFGDFDYTPTVEECQAIWNRLMEERRQIKVKLGGLERFARLVKTEWTEYERIGSKGLVRVTYPAQVHRELQAFAAAQEKE